MMSHNISQCKLLLMVNAKGGTDARVLKEVLDTYTSTLFPDAADDEEHHVLFNVDGDPG